MSKKMKCKSEWNTPIGWIVEEYDFEPGVPKGKKTNVVVRWARTEKQTALTIELLEQAFGRSLKLDSPGVGR